LVAFLHGALGVAGVELIKRRIQVTRDIVVSSAWAVPAGDQRLADVALVLGHGAGNDMNNPLLSFVHEALARLGVMTVKFNFPYKERGGKAPDRTPLLEATWQAVIRAVRADEQLAPGRLFCGGKSMGGRIASQLVADGEACAGLVFLGYPLHPPKRPEKLRAEHLSRVGCPMLFIQGTRDALCDLALLGQVLKRVHSPVVLHVIEGGDHSFNVPKRMGHTVVQIQQQIVDAIVLFLRRYGEH
jgi:predicted alpha/beta-hydrolase family hydrolase